MTASDPVLDRRRRIEHVAQLGQRGGYLLYGVAVVLFAVGFGAGFDRWIVDTIVGAMIAGSLLLAPAIVAGYAVKAADRDDREQGL